jgi:E3 ubiquitin-protein ligase RFWD2
VSGSDDYLVKIWNTDQPNSVHEIDMKANVCCAQYSPENAHCIAVGCVDQKAYVFDLRRLAEPVQILDSHRKAISYVKYLNANEIASASTDNTINVWNVNTGERTCTLRGHVNERNFVGLTTVGDCIACGSETNEVFIYRKDLSSPIASVGFARDAHEPRGFISACAWRSDDSVLVAANSNGLVKVLRI